ncbi:unnamed protein product [Spirodela intermedia]|uniref:Uncharacterized protein n=1 Tax=Spirodela intermedia TaxID=51605 RepID=A0ABN7E815_SPIIN|nr:unnamed protein product [Spirodela intermedia]
MGCDKNSSLPHGFSSGFKIFPLRSISLAAYSKIRRHVQCPGRRFEQGSLEYKGQSRGSTSIFPLRLLAIREEEVRVLIKTIAEISAADQMPNVSDMARCLLNNIICRQAFGRRCSNDGECRRNKFHDQLWESSNSWARSKAFNFFDNLLEEEIEDHLKCDNEDDRDFMGVLLRLQKDTSLGFSLTENKSRLSSWYANTNSLRRLRLLILCLVLQEIFLGGSDSTASVIEFGMLELALNPRVMNKAQEEVRRIVGGAHGG